MPNSRFYLLVAFSVLVISNLITCAIALRLSRRGKKLEERLAERNSKLHAFAVELIRAEEDQRSRIARELHDGVGQIMTAVNIELQLLHDVSPIAMKPRVEDVRALASQCQLEMRRVSHELRPAILDELGLAEAVRALAERMSKHAHITISCDVRGEVDRVRADSVIACYRLVQEALNNVVRHANAQSAAVTLHREADRLMVAITDDGRGIRYDLGSSDAMRDGHFGLIGMQERIAAIGGTFRYGSPSAGAKGARIEAELPVA